ncbi:MFS transporter [Kitasatospora arboriphila]
MVLTADVASLVAGIGMYLLMSLVTRFVQTPTSAGYGFGASVTVAGLALLPFSAASILTSRIAPRLARRTGTAAILPIGCAVSLLATLAFLSGRDRLWELFAVMGLAGLGVGLTFAVMPGLIVGAVPAHETGSAISFNQVLRYVGYSTGSALSGAVLQAHTPAGHALPTGDAYTAAALIGCAVWAVVGAATIVLPRRGAAAATAAPVRPAGPATAARRPPGTDCASPSGRRAARLRARAPGRREHPRERGECGGAAPGRGAQPGAAAAGGH